MKTHRIRAGLVLVGLIVAAATASAQSGDYRLNPGDVLRVSVWNEEELDVQEAIRTQLGAYVPDAVVTVSILAVNGNKVFVIGKVARPGEYVMTRTLDVMQVLAVAGGVTSFAAENKIQVLRRGPDGTQQAIPFRYGDVKEGEALGTNILLKSGDVVVVP